MKECKSQSECCPNGSRNACDVGDLNLEFGEVQLIDLEDNIVSYTKNPPIRIYGQVSHSNAGPATNAMNNDYGQGSGSQLLKTGKTWHSKPNTSYSKLLNYPHAFFCRVKRFSKSK